MAQAEDDPRPQAPERDVQNRIWDHARDQSRDQALAWFVRMQSGDATGVDRKEHAAWLAADPRNKCEYEKLGRFWSDLDHVRDPRPSARMTQDGRGPSRRMVLTGGIAASLGAGWLVLNGVPDFLRSDEYTGIGAMRRAALEDGSIVDLDADTALALHFDDQVRELRLQRGRARFTVAADPRPFRVHAEGGVITGQDTRFSVHLWDGTASVAVEDHAVTVAANGSGDVRLQQSQRLSYGNGALGTIEAFDAEIETAWMHGKLIFEDRPLRQVLADVSRYRSGVIHVTRVRMH